MGSRLQVLESQQKLAEWSERVAACRSSGRSVKDWCEENGISPGSYYRWQKRLFEMAAAEQSRATGQPPFAALSGLENHHRFAEIPVRRRNEPAAIVHFGGAEVEVFSGIDEVTLQMICRVLHHAE